MVVPIITVARRRMKQLIRRRSVFDHAVLVAIADHGFQLSLVLGQAVAMLSLAVLFVVVSILRNLHQSRRAPREVAA